MNKLLLGLCRFVGSESLEEVLSLKQVSLESSLVKYGRACKQDRTLKIAYYERCDAGTIRPILGSRGAGVKVICYQR